MLRTDSKLAPDPEEQVSVAASVWEGDKRSKLSEEVLWILSCRNTQMTLSDEVITTSVTEFVFWMKTRQQGDGTDVQQQNLG